jgi:PAS domain S-box-containing protein
MLQRTLRKMSIAEVDDLVPAFNEIARAGLLLGACFYTIMAMLHLAVQPPGGADILFGVATASALFFSAYHGALQNPALTRFGLRWAMLSITLVVWLNSALHLGLTGDATQTTNLAIGVIVAGIILMRRMEFLTIVVLSVAAFGATMAVSDPAQNWIHYGINLFEAIIVAGATFVWKRVAMLRGNDLRLQEQQARQDAEQNLRRAQDADATLRENEERFRMLFALAPVGIALNRMSDGRFLIGSKALFEMVGYSEAEFANLTYWDITPRDYDAEEARQLESLRTLGRYGPYEKEYIRKGGERFPVLLQGRRLTDGSGQELILSVIQDISAQKSTQAALAAARDAAEAANIAKSRFLATMSHELRTPLNAILGFSEIIARETFGPAGSPQYVEYARIVHESGTHLLSLIGDVLDLSKIEAGKMELKPEANDIAELLRESVRLAGVTRGGNAQGPKPQIKIAPDLPVLVSDRRATIQMIVNLISNAVKFTPAGGSVTVEAGRSADGGLFVSVIDTGIGIARADIPKALAPFSQVDDGRARHQGGTGLGLPIVKSLIEQHGGTLVLESEPGRGTQATLRFPPRSARAVAAA